MLERDLLYAYQGLKVTTKDKEPVEDHLLASITQGASNLHSDEDMEDKIKLLDPRVQKLTKTCLEVFGELPPPASCDKLVQMDVKLKPKFVGHKIRRCNGSSDSTQLYTDVIRISMILRCTLMQ